MRDLEALLPFGDLGVDRELFEQARTSSDSSGAWDRVGLMFLRLRTLSVAGDEFIVALRNRGATGSHGVWLTQIDTDRRFAEGSSVDYQQPSR